MTFIFQKFSNYGTSSPVVARTLPQAQQLLNATKLDEDAKKTVMAAVLEIQKQLVRCVTIRDDVQKEVSAGLDELTKKGLGPGPHYSLPGIPDLQARCENFLHAARLALFWSGRMVNALLRQRFGKEAPDVGHHMHKLRDWAAQTLGPFDPFTEQLVAFEPWVAGVVHARNCVDHPKDEPGGSLHVVNFHLAAGSNGAPIAAPPAWGLQGEPLEDLLTHMGEITDGILQVYEGLFAGCFHLVKGLDAMYLWERPETARDPQCPIRLYVGIHGLPKGPGPFVLRAN